MGTAKRHHHNHLQSLARYALTAGLVCLFSSTAPASDPAADIQAARGLEFARETCTNCHLVEDDGQAEVVTEAPTFWEIANLEEQSELRLRGFLVQPHYPMPPLELTRDQIDDLVVYILSLRSTP